MSSTVGPFKYRTMKLYRFKPTGMMIVAESFDEALAFWRTWRHEDAINEYGEEEAERMRNGSRGDHQAVKLHDE